MKHISTYTCTMAVLGLVCAGLCLQSEAGSAKPFRETGLETFVGLHEPGAIQHPFLEDLRMRMGRLEDMAVEMSQSSINNVGGEGVSTAYEFLYVGEDIPRPFAAILKFETVANGDQFVIVGYLFLPATPEDSLVIDAWFLPEEGTGRFLGAGGSITSVVPIPGGYVIEGTMTTVGAAKK